MITSPRFSLIKIFRWIATAAFVLAVWVALVAAISFAAPRDTALAVFAAPGRAIEVVSAANGNLLDAGAMVAIARSDEPDFIRRLYAAGAILVVDARESGGCTGFPRKSTSGMRL